MITCNDNTRKHLVDEFNYYKIPGNLEWLSDTEVLLDTPLDLETFKDRIINYPLIFVRHFFKVDAIISIDDLNILKDLHLDPTMSFSIQLRTPVELRKDMVAYRNELVDIYQAKDFSLNVKEPQQILTLFVEGDLIYYGLSRSHELISKWAGGAIHFSRSLATISRAEYKLREAFDTFPLNYTGNIAIDLGAAPGGWTKVLHDYGFEVYAIDPADLDAHLLSIPTIHHQKMTSQQFLKNHRNFSCDILVNDMKMSSRQSIHILEDFADTLTQDGYAIITIKLPKNYSFKDVLESLEQLRHHFKIINARQLFHNRNEFTAILKPIV